MAYTGMTGGERDAPQSHRPRHYIVRKIRRPLFCFPMYSMAYQQQTSIASVVIVFISILNYK